MRHITFLFLLAFVVESQAQINSPSYSLADIPNSVELHSFSIVEENCYAILEWRSNSELNLAVFDVLKSYDGISYEVITVIEAIGKTVLGQDYRFIDKSFRSGAYYKIRSRSLENTFLDSRPLHVENSCLKGFSILSYPNPVIDQLGLEVHAPIPGISKIEIINIYGASVLETTRAFDLGGNFFQLDTNTLARGSYTLKINFGNGFAKSVRFLKID